jgi:predicted phosphodiesterase
MRLGLLTDIHEHVEHLRSALHRLRAERVDQIVVIGDVFETGQRIEETCRLLAEARAIGVWGNHDYGLCVDPHPRVIERYPPAVIDYMASLKPRLEIGGCHFMHVEPWLNPDDIADLWYYEGPPDHHGKLARIFGAVPHRMLFAGHYHKWLLATPTRIDGWQGDVPVRLHDDRYFAVVGAVCDGCCAVFDTASSELAPFNLVAQAADRPGSRSPGPEAGSLGDDRGL